MLKPFAYSSITRNDESKAGDVFVDLGSTGFFSLPPPTTLPPHRTVINEQKKAWKCVAIHSIDIWIVSVSARM